MLPPTSQWLRLCIKQMQIAAIVNWIRIVDIENYYVRCHVNHVITKIM